jgi:hypothetical protein
VGAFKGCLDGLYEGVEVGFGVFVVGTAEGWDEGDVVGCLLGTAFGCTDGVVVGTIQGCNEGFEAGLTLG